MVSEVQVSDSDQIMDIKDNDDDAMGWKKPPRHFNNF